MRPVESRLEVATATTPTLYVVPVTAVGIPPSDVDLAWDKMRVMIGGVEISRDYDPGAAE